MTSPRRREPPTRLERGARLVTLGVCLGWLAYVLTSWTILWNPADAGAYYDAALRLVRGDDLYIAMHPDAHEVYRYAPWFAYAWIPLTSLPRDLALHLWSLAMLGCSLVAVWPLLRRGTTASIALAGLLGAFLAETAMFGNAHPAVVALLVVAARHPWMPVAVGVAASVKLVPFLFILPWLRLKAWRNVVIATFVGVALWAHVLAFDLVDYETDPGTGLLSFYAISPVLWLALAAGASAAAGVAIARGSRWMWAAVALVMFLGPPRVALSYLSFLIPAVVLTDTDPSADR